MRALIVGAIMLVLSACAAKTPMTPPDGGPAPSTIGYAILCHQHPTEWPCHTQEVSDGGS